jgi:hypothetical protein
MESKTEVKGIPEEVQKEAFKQMVVDLLEGLVERYDEERLDIFSAFNVKDKEKKIGDAIMQATSETTLTMKALVQTISLENPENLNELVAIVFILASFIKTLQIENPEDETRRDNS